MIQNIKQAVMASFVADALALGVHWVYRTSDIDEKYGRLESMAAPEIASKTQNTRTAIAEFGQMCSVEAALPSTIHLIAKYEDNLKEALVENIMAGGDSSARGMFAGFLIGAYNGPDAIPMEWLKDMIHSNEIYELLG